MSSCLSSVNPFFSLSFSSSMSRSNSRLLPTRPPHKNPALRHHENRLVVSDGVPSYASPFFFSSFLRFFFFFLLLLFFTSSSVSSSSSFFFFFSRTSKFVFIIVSRSLASKSVFICASSKLAMRFNFPFRPRNEHVSFAMRFATSSSFLHPLCFIPSLPFCSFSSSVVTALSRTRRSNSSSESESDSDDIKIASSLVLFLLPFFVKAFANFSAARSKLFSHHFSSQLYLFSFLFFPTPRLSFFSSNWMLDLSPVFGSRPNPSPSCHPNFASMARPKPYPLLPSFCASSGSSSWFFSHGFFSCVGIFMWCYE